MVGAVVDRWVGHWPAHGELSDFLAGQWQLNRNQLSIRHSSGARQHTNPVVLEGWTRVGFAVQVPERTAAQADGQHDALHAASISQRSPISPFAVWIARNNSVFCEVPCRFSSKPGGPVAFLDVSVRFDHAQEGPDFEGQTRRLRTYDGVYFTKAGAEKLGHYVEHDLRRVLTRHVLPVALPGPEERSPAKDAGVGRPAIGPVVPLSADRRRRRRRPFGRRKPSGGTGSRSTRDPRAQSRRRDRRAARSRRRFLLAAC